MSPGQGTRHRQKSSACRKPFSSYEQMLREGDIDAVTICTPIGLHFDQVCKPSKRQACPFNKTMVTRPKPMRSSHAHRKKDVRLVFARQFAYTIPTSDA